MLTIFATGESGKTTILHVHRKTFLALISKDLSIGGSNLTNINFESLSNQIKFVDALKYY